MIVSQNRRFLGSKVATIRNRSFVCTFRTAKKGLYKNQHTVIFHGDYVRDRKHSRIHTQITYVSSLNSRGRLHCHDFPANELDRLGESGVSFEMTVQRLLAEFKKRGMFSETMKVS